jgi:transcription termination/antitermination protein NusG
LPIFDYNAKTGLLERDHWYALYTRHQHEKTIAGYLSTCGFEAFLPLYDVVNQWKDRTKRVSLPLFPSYIFLRGGMDRRVKILSTPGVYAIVGIANRPAPIPATEIEAIRLAVNSSLRLEPHPFLCCGDRVRIRTGALAGVEGLLLRKKNLYRLVLSATLLGKSIAVEVDVRSVERIIPSTIASPPVGRTVAPWERECVIESGNS